MFSLNKDLGETDNVLRLKIDASFGVENSAAVWEYQYDAYGNPTRETDPYGNAVEQTWYTDFSVLKSRTDKNGHVFKQTIDAHGNVTRPRRAPPAREEHRQRQPCALAV